jgi:hypothetical protein
VRRPGGVRAVLAVAGERDVDDVRFDAFGRRIADAQAVEDAGPELFDDDVRRRQKREKYFDAFFRAEIDGQGALGAVDGEETRRFLFQVRRVVAHIVRRVHILDLDDVGAHVGKQHRAQGARIKPGQIENPDALQRAAGRFVAHGAPFPAPAKGGFAGARDFKWLRWWRSAWT